MTLDPLDYPWAAPKTPGVATARGFMPLTSSNPGDVDTWLRREDAAPLSERELVVAVGSNAAPEVMRRKFAKLPATNQVFPIVPAVVAGLAVGHSAHVSAGGYIAAAPYKAEGETSALWASYLDAFQLSALDATEPNYERVALSATEHPCVIGAGDRPHRFSVYRSVHGVVGVGGRVRRLGSQLAMWRLLAQLGAPDVDRIAPTKTAVFLAGSADARDRLSSWLAERAVGDRLATWTAGGVVTA